MTPRDRTHVSSSRLLLLVALTLALTGVASPGAAASLDELTWMVGNWKGPAMGGTLEERWAPADGKTMSALVRSTASGATNMVEVIVISETEDGLELRLRQFDPDLTPRTPEPAVFALESMDERSVTWKNTASEGPLATLTYASPSEDTFQVKIGLRTGNELVLELAAE